MTHLRAGGPAHAARAIDPHSADLHGAEDRILETVEVHGRDGRAHTVRRIERLAFDELGNGALIPVAGPMRHELDTGEPVVELGRGLFRITGTTVVLRSAEGRRPPA